MASKSESDHRGGWLIVVVVLVVVAAAATVGVVVLKGGSSSAGASVLLEPAGSIGTDPFTASVAIGPAVEFPGNVRAITVAMHKTLPSDSTTHTLIATGTAPGLYGGSGDKHVCNPQQLVTFLTQHPDKAAAWASVLGIAPSSIAGYVGSLTPVVLTTDTLVTNHGYRDGRATTLQSVLEAGTAVMVDSYGVPRVKCNCGNPLTPPQLVNPARLHGTAWPGYAASQVAVVHPGAPLPNLVVVNITTGKTYNQPTGTAGQFVASSNAKIFTSADGTGWKQTTTIPGYTNALVAGGGKLLALANSAGQTLVWSVGTSGSTHISELPSEPSSIAYGSGRWVLTTVDHTSLIGSIYTSTDATSWTKAGVTVQSTAWGAGSGYRVPVAYGNGTWVAVGSTQGSVYASRDGLHWARNGSNAVPGNVLSLAFGAGVWVLGTGDGAMTSRDAVSWTPASNAVFNHRQISTIAYGNGRWLASGQAPDGAVPMKSALYSSTNATTWSQVGQSFVPDALTFGGSPEAASTPPTTPTTTPPQSSGIENVDFRNYEYEDRGCGASSQTPPLVRVVNGKYKARDPLDNFPGQEYCGMTIDTVTFADVTGDGVKDAVVTGSAFYENLKPWTMVWTTVFAATPTGPKNLGYWYGVASPPYSAAGGVNVWQGVMGTVGTCCVGSYDRVTYKYSGGKMLETAHATNIPPSAAPPTIVKAIGG